MRTVWTETLHPTSGSGVTKTSGFTYAPDGAMASRTVDGKTTSYTHWRNGLEKTTVPWDSAGTVSSTWMPNASPNVVTQPGGVTTTYTYDPAARISSKRVVKGTSGLSSWQQVTYDGDDNRTGELVSQVQPGGATKMGTGTFAYDRLGRLVSAKHPLETASADTYVLDDAGNIVNDGKLAYAYSHNRLTRSESLEPASLGVSDSYSYDAAGNMVGQCCQARTRSLEDGSTVSSSRSVTFGYDGSSHTSRVQVSTSETYDHPLLEEPITFSSSQAVYYTYDALGRLVRRNQGGATELFFHDRQSQQVALETDGAGAVATRYVLDSTGSPIGQQKGAVFGWYVTDLRANLTQVLDATGAVKSVFGYDPFGKDKSQLTSVSGGFDSRLRYQMAPRDKTVGMYSLGPRLLDPAINRFGGADFYVAAAANMDLALDALTGNRYLYAGANPAGMVDDGHEPSGMNQAEWNYCRWPSRWKLCYQVRQITDRIRSDEKMRFPNDPARRNAYRHCCWAAEMTIRLGENTARGFLDRHEYGANPRDPDHQADLRNNESGIRIAHSVRGHNANERAARAEWLCYRAAAEGRLVLVG